MRCPAIRLASAFAWQQASSVVADRQMPRACATESAAFACIVVVMAIPNTSPARVPVRLSSATPVGVCAARLNAALQYRNASAQRLGSKWRACAVEVWKSLVRYEIGRSAASIRMHEGCFDFCRD
jgi:hypothetical protein